MRPQRRWLRPRAPVKEVPVAVIYEENEMQVATFSSVVCCMAMGAQWRVMAGAVWAGLWPARPRALGGGERGEAPPPARRAPDAVAAPRSIPRRGCPDVSAGPAIAGAAELHGLGSKQLALPSERGL